MKLTISVVATFALLSACSSSGPGAVRFAGFNTCSADGSVVWFERANKDGKFEGLNNGPCKAEKD